ncbi:hypothetical protein [Kineococcus sp. R86509]|uniref:hypothetical protein n=1 Tax=Kineococcus sp. R86509 TaxID=3093851 RepID=UPI0036D20B6B
MGSARPDPRLRLTDPARTRRASGDPRTLRDLFTTALDELGAPDLNDHQASWVMAHTHARSIVEGLITPEEGAELIWGISSSLGFPDELGVFVNEATDWEYAWELDEDDSRRCIIQGAVELLEAVTQETISQEPDPDFLPVSWHQIEDE